MEMDYLYRVHTRSLYKLLGFKGEKIPKDFSKDFENVACPLDYLGKRTVTLNLMVYSGGKGSGHRIYAVCPQCHKEVPVGRLGQHIGAKSTCVAPWRRKIVVTSSDVRDPWNVWTTDPERLIAHYNNNDQGRTYQLVQS